MNARSAFDCGSSRYRFPPAVHTENETKRQRETRQLMKPSFSANCNSTQAAQKSGSGCYRTPRPSAPLSTCSRIRFGRTFLTVPDNQRVEGEHSGPKEEDDQRGKKESIGSGGIKLIRIGKDGAQRLAVRGDIGHHHVNCQRQSD